LHHIAIQRLRRAVLREQRYLRRALLILAEDLDGSTPGGLLRLVYLTEIGHVALLHTQCH